MNCNKYLENVFKNDHIVVACHRGTNGGNIVQNTYMSYVNSLLHGANMIEIDTIMSTDGVFYAFHDGNEKNLFGGEKNIREMSSSEINLADCINSVNLKDGHHIERLSNILPKLKGKCLINIDRSWFYLKETLIELNKYNMLDQIILKTPVEEKYLHLIKEFGSNIMYMPIVYNRAEIELTRNYGLNLVAFEMIFDSLDHELLDKQLINELKKEGYHLWVNAITLSSKHLLSAGLGDDGAILNGLDENYGKLLDLGFDMIQTDWPGLLKPYIDKKYKKI